MRTQETDKQSGSSQLVAAERDLNPHASVVQTERTK